MDIDENILQCEGGEECQVTVVPCKTQHSSAPSHCRECSATSLLHAVAIALDYSVQSISCMCLQYHFSTCTWCFEEWSVVLAAEGVYTVHKMSISLGISLHIYQECHVYIFNVPESLMLHHLVYMYKYTGV